MIGVGAGCGGSSSSTCIAMVPAASPSTDMARWSAAPIASTSMGVTGEAVGTVSTSMGSIAGAIGSPAGAGVDCVATSLVLAPTSSFVGAGVVVVAFVVVGAGLSDSSSSRIWPSSSSLSTSVA
ncbi:hypothetical protein C8R46DRAFT_1102000 [Mycena filopes]|nr:hypothetical protein C8R46DRAFT_1102000 [Mycena filopes]